ncbi:hypothetical protein HYFRA_00002908 [Hymenoscyphus fraxineus]|uniref:Aminoglycoside phosphotransferase domain-containing protein n=1 Tax=Hymenoscyphus fraxineus TaxID=746836 RepID=A0A9N9KQ41_9HELO|nr:hypothetical protein HYFRA_00002908 [Hymenoscyphus fraxineus]
MSCANGHPPPGFDVPWFPQRVYLGKPPSLEEALLEHKNMLWEKAAFGYYAADWLKAPRINTMKDEIRPYLPGLEGNPSSAITIKLWTKGYINRIYEVKSPDLSIPCILRVSLPVDPWYKVESEVATMLYVAKHTTIPVPRVFAFDSSTDNPIGFEWILMEKMSGVPFNKRTTLSIQQEREALMLVAGWLHQLESLKFDKIGSIFCDWEKGTFDVGRVVDPFFMYAGRVGEDFHRGPYKDLREFLMAKLDLTLKMCRDPKNILEAVETELKLEADRMEEERQRRLEGERSGEEQKNGVGKTNENKDQTNGHERVEEEEGEHIEKNEGEQVKKDLTVAEDISIWYLPVHLSDIIPKECSALAEIISPLLERPGPPPSTYLSHHDLHGGNFLVDKKTGRPTALLDYEMMYPMPRLCDWYSDKHSKQAGLPEVLKWIINQHWASEEKAVSEVDREQFKDEFLEVVRGGCQGEAVDLNDGYQNPDIWRLVIIILEQWVGLGQNAEDVLRFCARVKKKRGIK